MEKKADVAARLARNSPAIGSKKAPKLYIVPKTTKPTVNATITMIQARVSPAGWPQMMMNAGWIRSRLSLLADERVNTKHAAAATLRFVLSLYLLLFENQPAGLCH